MKVFTKLFLTFALLCFAGVVNAATEYEVDQKFTSVAALEGQLFAIVNETDGKAIYNKDAQNLAYDTYANAIAGTAYLYKLHSLAEESDANVQNAYAIEVVKADGSSIGLWGNSAIYLNSGAEGGFDGCFVLGNKDQYGTDVKYGGAWEIEYAEGQGFALKNVARGGYFAGVNPAPTGTDPIYWTLCTMKEAPQTDPLAEQKDALTAAIATGKMYFAVAYTEATFSALSTAITDGEAALAAEGATAESLTNATTAINNAIAALALKDGFTNLTAEMFMSWDSATEPTTGATTGCSFELFKPSGLPYGDGNVGWKNFALLSDYDKLYVTFTEGTPRVMMNRDVDQGQWNEDETQSHLIEFPKGDAVWSAKYFTNENGVVTVDLKQIVADKGLASLNAIKGANWANVTVTGLFLYKEAAAPAEDVLPIDIQFGADYNNESVSSYDNSWTATKDGKTWTLVNFNNNKNAWSSVKCGRKNVASVASITSPAINAVVTNYVVTLAKAANVNSAKLAIMNGDTQVGEDIDITANFVAGDVNVPVEGQKGYSYKLTIDNASASANGSVEITKIALYGEGQYVDVHIANTIEDPYTVAKAFELIDAGQALNEVVFVKGIISKIDSVNAEQAFITYWISADGTAEGQQLQCYKGKTLEGLALADIEVGAEVIVKGNLKKYGETYEFDANNEIAAYKAPVKPAIADGTYYIKNVASGNFLTGANSWGTQASVAPSGAPFEITFLTEGGYSLKYILSTVNNKFLGSNLYVDSTTPAGGFTIEKNEDNTFAIKLGDKYLAEGTEKGSTNDAILVQAETLTDAAKWQILTLDEAVAALKASTNAGATFLISNPNFNRNTSTAAWTVSADCTNKNLSGGADGNRCAESYHSTFTISQVLANAPAGKYQMTAQGFYRQDDGAEEAAPVFFANDKEAQVPVKTGTENSMNDASASFTAGSYTIEPFEFTVFEDGQLTIGVKNNGNTHQWVIWDNFQITYLTSEIPAGEFEPAYTAALAAAKAALADENYAAVTGEEKAALEKAIADYGEIAEPTTELYKAAISALNAATSAFTTAKGAYETFNATAASMADVLFPYAAPGKKAAAEASTAATPKSAADATALTEAVLKAYRQYAESSALLECQFGAAVNMTDSVIVNPNAQDDIAEPWAVVLGEGSGGSLGTLGNEPLTDGDGNSAYKYFDGGNWGANAWDVALEQTITLPAGKYYLTVAGRASADVDMTLFAGENTAKIAAIGASGGLFGRGWGDASVEFEMAEAGNIKIGVRGVTEKVHNWMSFTRFRLMQFGVAGEDAPELQAPEGWNNEIANGNLAGDNVDSYASKEYPAPDPSASTIVAMAGKDFSRGIVVKAQDKVSQAWDSQFWIVLNEELPAGATLHVEFDYKADKAGSVSTQSHAAPGGYLHWACIGNVNFTTEWQHFSAEVTVDAAANNMKSIAFNLNDIAEANNYYFDNFGVWAKIPEKPKEWENIIVNSDMEGTDNSCFYVTEQGVGGPFLAPFTAGIGVNGSKAVKVQSADNPTNSWDTQFFIRLPYQLPAGTQYKVQFDYKADEAAKSTTQAHANPGDYIHYVGIGDVNFTADWQSFELESIISADQSKEDKPMQSIAFNLAELKTANLYIFDNVKFFVPKDIVSSLNLNPAVDPQPYPEPDGISTLKNQKNVEGMYNLNGQKVNKAQKGLYILNGKKVMVK